MYKGLKTYIEQAVNGCDQISPNRKEKLDELSSYIRTRLNKGEQVKLHFICTHNSRRSHLAQIWTSAAAHYFGIDSIETYSGGTETTAFNPRAVAALERAGIKIVDQGGVNSVYEVKFSDHIKPMWCFSKTFDHEINPQKDFAAIMTCSEADENCPFVPGTAFRASITYRDPKESDGTDREKEVYDERCLQIATEMLYMIGRV